MTSRRNNWIACSGILALGFGGGALALESDRNQDVMYSSEGKQTIQVEGNSRVLTLRDNVRVTQGTIEITGSEASFVYNIETNELERVSVTGSPATYEQQINEAGDMARGTSNRIDYFAQGEAVIELTGDVQFRQPGLVNYCPRFRYFVDSGDFEGESCQGVLSRQETQPATD